MNLFSVNSHHVTLRMLLPAFPLVQLGFSQPSSSAAVFLKRKLALEIHPQTTDISLQAPQFQHPTFAATLTGPQQNNASAQQEAAARATFCRRTTAPQFVGADAKRGRPHHVPAAI
jgi:hypothetical protein